MSSLVQVIITRLSDGEKFEGTGFKDEGKCEAIWYEGGLRHVFYFRDDGSQIGSSKYSLEVRRANI